MGCELARRRRHGPLRRLRLPWLALPRRRLRPDQLAGGGIEEQPVPQRDQRRPRLPPPQRQRRPGGGDLGPGRRGLGLGEMRIASSARISPRSLATPRCMKVRNGS